MLKRFGFCLIIQMLIAKSLLAYAPLLPDGVTFDTEFLYMMPSIGDTSFVITGIQPAGAGTVFQGQRANDSFTFFPGFRAALKHDLYSCDRQILVAYSWLNAAQQRTITGSNLTASLPLTFALIFDNTNFLDYSGSAGANIRTLYQRLDLLFSQQACCVRSFDVNLEGGLQLSGIRTSQIYSFRGNLNGAIPIHYANPQLELNSYGIGPQVGINVDYKIQEFCGSQPGFCSITGYARGSLISSYVTGAESSQEDGVSQGKFEVQAFWGVAASLHARLGLKICRCLCYSTVALEGGYEYDSYTFPSAFTYDLQGLYLGGNIAF